MGDVSNGMHSILGNGHSTDYHSQSVAGTMYMNAGDYASVYTYSNSDSSVNIQHESGFGCHLLPSDQGFHADMAGDQGVGTGWSKINTWRIEGDPALYTYGGMTESEYLCLSAATTNARRRFVFS